MSRASRRARLSGLAAAIVLALSACSTTVAGTPVKIGAGSGTNSQEPPADGPIGLKKNAPKPKVATKDADNSSELDVIARATVEDLYIYYNEIFERDFKQKFTPAKELVSYDSNNGPRVCNFNLNKQVNAMYMGICDTIVWDRGVLLPMLEKEVGVLAAPTVLAHEMGHLVQARLKTPRTSSLVLEQQADCYAGAYWRWVGQGNSKYFDFTSDKGMRQVLSAVAWTGDPVGMTGDTARAHGNSFDRTFAASVGYANGPTACSKIDQQSVDKSGSQIPFNSVPKNYGNTKITKGLMTDVASVLDDYFGKTVPGYKKPKLEAYDGDVPGCEGGNPKAPADYCASTKSVRYSLPEMVKLGTPEAAWKSTRGDFSAIIILASRYALAAQATGGGSLTGNQAGLRALCYAGTWAKWMFQPRGAKGLQLSPNDLNKAIYQILASDFAATDVNSKTSTQVLDQVQALHIGVVYDIEKCFDFYST